MRTAFVTACGLSTASLIAFAQAPLQSKPAFEIWNGLSKKNRTEATRSESSPRKSKIEIWHGNTKVNEPHQNPGAAESDEEFDQIGPKDVARRLLFQARIRADQGNYSAARLLATRASAYAVEWDTFEETPDEFLAELAVLGSDLESGQSPSAGQFENSGSFENLGVWAQPVEVTAPASPVEMAPESEFDSAVSPIASTSDTVEPSFAPFESESDSVAPIEAAPLPPFEQKPVGEQSSAGDQALDRQPQYAPNPYYPQQFAPQYPPQQPNVVVVRDSDSAPQAASQADPFSSILVNLITVFATLLAGFFILVCTLMIGLRKLTGGVNFRIELINNSPPAAPATIPNINITMPTGVAMPATAAVPATHETTPGYSAQGGDEAESEAPDTRSEHKPLRAADFADGTLPFFLTQETFDDRKLAAEEEQRAREEAMLKFIFEQNVAMRDELAALSAA